MVDGGNNCIQKFSCDGRFIAALGTLGSSQLQIDLPVGIKVNLRNKRVYVADQYNNRVQVLHPNLIFFLALVAMVTILDN